MSSRRFCRWSGFFMLKSLYRCENLRSRILLVYRKGARVLIGDCFKDARKSKGSGKKKIRIKWITGFLAIAAVYYFIGDKILAP